MPYLQEPGAERRTNERARSRYQCITFYKSGRNAIEHIDMSPLRAVTVQVIKISVLVAFGCVFFALPFSRSWMTTIAIFAAVVSLFVLLGKNDVRQLRGCLKILSIYPESDMAPWWHPLCCMVQRTIATHEGACHDNTKICRVYRSDGQQTLSK